MKTTRGIYYLIWTILSLAAITILYFGFLLLYPVDTLKINGISIITKTIKPGDLFVYQVDYCKYTTAGAIVYRTMHKTDESRIETFPAVQTISVLGCKQTRVPLQTYPTMEAGEYYLLVDAIFYVNPLRQEHVVFKTESFQVVE